MDIQIGALTNHSHHTDLGRSTLSVWNFWRRISDQKDLSVWMLATSGYELLCVSFYRHHWFNFQGESPLKAFHNGDRVQVKILGFRDTKTHKYFLSLWFLLWSQYLVVCCTSRMIQNLTSHFLGVSKEHRQVGFPFYHSEAERVSLTNVLVSCSWAGHFTFTVPLSFT